MAQAQQFYLVDFLVPLPSLLSCFTSFFSMLCRPADCRFFSSVTPICSGLTSSTSFLFPCFGELEFNFDWRSR